MVGGECTREHAYFVLQQLFEFQRLKIDGQNVAYVFDNISGTAKSTVFLTGILVR